MRLTFYTKSALAGILVLLFWSCGIQGPWEYDFEESSTHAGIHVFAYIIADEPIDDVCFDKMWQLDETSTRAFAFYKSHNVQISGRDTTGVQKTVTLQPELDRVNCFSTNELVGVRGEQYELTARFVWDSAGVDVTTDLSGIAKIPTYFRAPDSAKVLSWALNAGGTEDIPINQGDSTDLLAFLGSFPPQAQEDFLEIYGEELSQFTTQEETLQWYQENLARVNQTADSLLLLYEEQVFYQEGDTVFYMTGSRNTKSHTFDMDFSEDVGSVLVTQIYSDDFILPTNPFAEIGGFTPDIEDLFEGTGERRLINYPKGQGPNFSSLDSMGIVNTWFYGGENVLYFHGMDPNYLRYTETFVEENTEAGVLKQFNIEGAQGFFVGGVVDSFKVFIKIPENTLQYSGYEAQAAWCNSQNWNSKTCRAFASQYCIDVNYNDSIAASAGFRGMEKGGYYSCEIEKYQLGLDSGITVDSLQTYVRFGGALTIDSLTIQFSPDAKIEGEAYTYLEEAMLRKCAESDYSLEYCDAFQSDCWQGNAQCKTSQWNYCLDNNWRGDACQWSLVTYCRDNNINSSVLCGPADDFCRQNPNHAVCQ